MSGCQECKMAAPVETELKLLLKSLNTKRVRDVMVNLLVGEVDNNLLNLSIIML